MEAVGKAASRFFDGVKKSIQNLFLDMVNNKGVTVVVVTLLLAAVTIPSIFLSAIRDNIRGSELESVVYNNFLTEKVIFFDYPDKDAVIQKEDSIIVMFASPHGDSFQEALDVLNLPETEAQMNRPIYFYPVVYQKNSMEASYRISGQDASFIYFEKGVEKHRFTLGELSDVKGQLADAVNRLSSADFTAAGTAEEPVKEEKSAEEIPAEETQTGISGEEGDTDTVSDPVYEPEAVNDPAAE